MTDQTPTIKSLSSRDASKDARQAFNYSALLIAQLPNGQFALCDRTQNFYLLVDEPPTRDQFILFHKLLNTSRMSAEARFLGEPTPTELGRDIHRQFSRPRPKASRPTLQIEIDL